nr:translation initiation factor IF-2-like [Anser cygnoides]
MHLHLREAAGELEEAQADTTRGSQFRGGKETVKTHISQPTKATQPKRMGWETFARPSPVLAFLTCCAFSSRCPCVCVCVCAGPERGGVPSPSPRRLDGVAGAGVAPRGSRGGGQRGQRRGAAGRGAILREGAASPPPRGCGQTVLMPRQKAGPSGGGPAGAGERNTVREGKEKKFRGRGIIIIMEEEGDGAASRVLGSPRTERLQNEGASPRRKNYGKNGVSKPADFPRSGDRGGVRVGARGGGGGRDPRRSRAAQPRLLALLSRVVPGCPGAGATPECHRRHWGQEEGCCFPLMPAGREGCFPLLFSFCAKDVI